MLHLCSAADAGADFFFGLSFYFSSVRGLFNHIGRFGCFAFGGFFVLGWSGELGGPSVSGAGRGVAVKRRAADRFGQRA